MRANFTDSTLCRSVGTLVSHIPMSTLSPSAVPSDLIAITDALDAADRDAGQLVGDLDHAQFNWRPDGGGWSIAQCLDHLVRANSIYLDALRAGAARARTAQFVRRGPIRPGVFSRLFIRAIGPASGMRLPAPSASVPASDLRKEAVLPAFLRIQEDVRAFAQACADLDLNRARFVNPFVRGIRFSVGTGLLVIAAHDRRHLGQAHRVREAASFPPHAAHDATTGVTC
jgi:DinB superfamily